MLDFQMKVSELDREAARVLVNDICGASLFGNGGKQPEAIYRYRDAQGRPAFEKLRYPGKNFRLRRLTTNGYVWNLDGVKKPLYNLPEVLTANEIIVDEGEKDADNVASAIQSLNRDDLHIATTTNFDGAGKWNDEYNPYFLGKRVVILLDNDDVGRRHAETVAAAVHQYAVGVKVVHLPGLPEHGDVSDFLASHSAQELIDEINRTQQWFPAHEIPAWREAFKSYDELATGPFEFLIDRFLPYGITFFGGLPGTGKSWLALSVTKALTTGKNFLGRFPVIAPRRVIYLAPESADRAFRCRLDAMRLNDSLRLLCRTYSSGPTLALDSPELLGAVRSVRPVVILDTAIRFSSAENENDAAQNRKLAKEMQELLSAGALAIIAIHHSPKASGTESETKLENTLRGTGDFGALADAVYSLRCEDQQSLSVVVRCVKPREFEAPPPFRIQGRPYINEIGDFALIEETSNDERLARALGENPEASLRDLAQLTGIGKNSIGEMAGALGWKKVEGVWTLDKKLIQ